MLATTLYEELVGLGFDRSYDVGARDRELGLRGVRVLQAGGVKLTVGLEHERVRRYSLTGWSCQRRVGCEGVCAGRGAVALGEAAWLLFGW